ncbi:MAG: DUF1302 domain-containing protein [Rhodocyclaceae bacterium]|nr:MAG: DUF1302 domain-containing protein [Rhodocyclaceae bacterium]
MNGKSPNVQGLGLSTKVCSLSIAIASLCAASFVPSNALAFEIEGTGDVKMRWDNTLKYTAAWRMNNPDGAVANQNGAQPNVDFGDMAFKKGMINNRVDLLSEFDLAYQNLGARISGAAWYDAEYNKNHNDFVGAPPNTIAAAMGGPNNLIPKAAKNIMGQRAEIADAFVYGKFDIEDKTLSLRVGKHSLIYGESLFLGNNGIAAAQGPVDAVKLLSLPNVQFKEVAMPVGQVSGNFSISPDVSIGAYFQYQWKENRIPAAGSYFGVADFVGAGSDVLLTPPPFGTAASRSPDSKGSDSGQWGMQVKFKVGDVDYGLYAARYDDKNPIAVLNLGSILAGAGTLGGGTYNLMYAKDIKVYGASFSTVFGETNVAGEISTRRNVPLVVPGDLILNSAVANADNNRNTPYARGNSLHLNLSAIALFSGNGLWGGASLTGEYAYNRLLDVTYRPAYAVGLAPDPLNSTHTRDASAIRVVFQPEFFQVMPGVDIQMPIGLGYGLSGRSAVVQLSPEHGGDFSIGANATIDRTWKTGLNYTHFFGEKGTAPSSAVGAVSTYAAYKQYYADRDFISFTVQRTF